MRSVERGFVTVLIFLILGSGVASVSRCTSSQVGQTRGYAQHTVIASAQVYDVVMTALGELYRAGRLSESQKNQAIVYANTYRYAALKVAAGVEREEYDALVAQMTQALTNLKGLLGGDN